MAKIRMSEKFHRTLVEKMSRDVLVAYACAMRQEFQVFEEADDLSDEFYLQEEEFISSLTGAKE